jgi:hypothetical protein
MTYHSRHRRSDRPLFRWRIGTIAVPRQQHPCLVEFMFGRMILELGGAQVPIGNPHREFCAFERLHGRCTALNQRTCAVEINFGLIQLNFRAFDRGRGAFPRSLDGAQPLLGFASASRIEQRRRRGHDRSDHLVGADPIAGLEAYPRQPPGERRCHHIPLADARFAVLVDGGNEAPLSDSCCFHRNRPWHHRPGNSRQSRENAQRNDRTADRDAHGQSLVLSTPTRSRLSIRRRTTYALAAAAAKTTTMAAA